MIEKGSWLMKAFMKQLPGRLLPDKIVPTIGHDNSNKLMVNI
jgi:hypothetical protein